jgi:hypothetical protein
LVVSSVWKVNADALRKTLTGGWTGRAPLLLPDLVEGRGKTALYEDRPLRGLEIYGKGYTII